MGRHPSETREELSERRELAFIVRAFVVVPRRIELSRIDIIIRPASPVRPSEL